MLDFTGTLFCPNNIWFSPFVVLDGFFFCSCVYFVFMKNGFGKVKPIFQHRGKQIVQCNCIAYMSLKWLIHVKKVQNIFNPITN